MNPPVTDEASVSAAAPLAGRRQAGGGAAAGRSRGLRQAMAGLHGWAGLLCGWVLYAMFLTGSVSYFKDEITAWMRPEQGRMTALPAAPELAARMVAEIARRAPAGSPQWRITLPEPRHPVGRLRWRELLPVATAGVAAAEQPAARGAMRTVNRTLFVEPQSLAPLSGRATRGGEFFYRFHFNLHYLPPVWGRWIAGLCAMFMLVAIISGVIIHKKIFADFFTFRWGKGARAWMDAHNGLSVLGLPFHLMITYSGLVALMVLYMPWGQQLAERDPQRRAALAAEAGFRQPGPPSGVAAPLADLAPMVAWAEAHWGEHRAQRITINNPGDAAARVLIEHNELGRVSVSPRYLLFDGVSGRLLKVVDEALPARQTQGTLVGLHMGRFADVGLRWLYFLVSLAGTAMVGSGLVLWTVKRRAKLPDPARPGLGFWLVERLNIATLAGLPVAMAAFLWGNRLLPLALPARAAHEIDLFFVVWALTLLYAMIRPPRRGWIELFGLAALLLALLPVLNALSTDRPLWRSLHEGDWMFAGVELTALVLAALCAELARRTARHRPASEAGPARKRGRVVSPPTVRR